MNRNRELQKQRVASNPRVEVPRNRSSRSAQLIEKEALPGIYESTLDYEEIASHIPIPDELSDLLDDFAHRTVTDEEKADWNKYKNIRIVTSTTTELITDYTIVANKITTININLLPATGSGRELQIANINTGMANVVPYATDTINGETSQYVRDNSCMDIKDYATGKWIIF